MKVTLRTVDFLLVDGENLAHRAYHAHTGIPEKTLQTSLGLLSGCFYGFFSMLLRKVHDYGPRRTFVCWGDARKNLKRLEIYPSYKAHRGAHPLDLHTQMQDIKRALFNMEPLYQVFSPGYEADDVLAQLVHSYTTGPAKVCLVSGDKDLLQVVTPKDSAVQVFVVQPASGAVKHDTELWYDDVVAKYHVPPEMLADYLSLVGDSSDNVPGVEGVGEKTAAKLLMTYGPIKQWIHTIDTLEAVSAKVRQHLTEQKTQLAINKRLVSLSAVNLQGCSLQRFSREHLYNLDEPTQTATALFDKYEMLKIRPEHFARY